MIFWSTLLALMIGIVYYLSLPISVVDSDLDKATSEVLIVNFLEQHRAAKRYADDTIVTLPGAFNVINKKLLPEGYNDGIMFLDFGDKGYISPFQEVPGVLYYDNGNPQSKFIDLKDNSDEAAGRFTSMIVCTAGSDNWGGLSVKEHSDDSDNSDSDSPSMPVNKASFRSCALPGMKYVVSYGYVPSSTVLPAFFSNRKTATQKSIVDRTKRNIDCGYLKKIKLANNASAYAVVNAGIKYRNGKIQNAYSRMRRLPMALSDALGLSSISAEDLSSLAVCVTPLNEPYVKDGLVFHYDAIINKLDDDATPIHTTFRKQTDKDDKEDESEDEKNVSDDVKWYNLVNPTSDEEALTLTAEAWDTSRLNTYKFDGTNSTKLEIPFNSKKGAYTISYLINYPNCALNTPCISPENTYSTLSLYAENKSNGVGGHAEDDPFSLLGLMQSKHLTEYNRYTHQTGFLSISPKREGAPQTAVGGFTNTPSVGVHAISWVVNGSFVSLYVNGSRIYDQIPLNHFRVSTPYKIVFGGAETIITVPVISEEQSTPLGQFEFNTPTQTHENYRNIVIQGLIADLYNIKIYDRALSEQEIKKNAISDFKRYNLKNLVN